MSAETGGNGQHEELTDVTLVSKEEEMTIDEYVPFSFNALDNTVSLYRFLAEQNRQSNYPGV